MNVEGCIVIKKHPTLDIYCLSDGRLLKRTNGRTNKYDFTYGTMNKKGYMVTQCEGKQYRVHRLIADAFLPNPENKPTVDHIDRNRLNNRLSNLRWADLSEQKNNSSLVINRLQLGVRQSEDQEAYTDRWREYAQNNIYMYAEVRRWRKTHPEWRTAHWKEVKQHCKECHGRRIKEY